MNLICSDGEFLPADQPVHSASNRSYRYGYGLFETIKFADGKLLLRDYHFDRLFAGLKTLGIPVPSHFTADLLEQKITELCLRNQCAGLARVRLSLSGGSGGYSEGDDKLRYLIECQPLEAQQTLWNEKGLTLGIFPGARKAADNFSHLKTASFLPYIMAARHARENGLDDCLVLNAAGNIADSSRANIFLVTGNHIITPPLQEACVEGVMRRWLLDCLRNSKKSPELLEKPVTPGDLLQAREIFLTNAISGIRWVRQCGETRYACDISRALFRQFIQP